MHWLVKMLKSHKLQVGKASHSSFYYCQIAIEAFEK